MSELKDLNEFIMMMMVMIEDAGPGKTRIFIDPTVVLSKSQKAHYDELNFEVEDVDSDSDDVDCPSSRHILEFRESESAVSTFHSSKRG